MNFAKIHSGAINMLSAYVVDVEVDISNGLHSFSIIGLPDKAVEEARDRVSAAIKNSGFESPKSHNQKIVISLAPADIKKEGTAHDVATALAYLVGHGDVVFDSAGKMFLGELSLDGRLRKISGVLPIARKARDEGFKEIYLPPENMIEAAVVPDIDIFGARTLGDIIDHLLNKENKRLTKAPLTKITPPPRENLTDFADVKGQETAKRGLEIAAAGGHNIAFWGPAGTGKTMLARAFPGILPPLSYEEMIEVTSIHSAAAALKENLITEPPFRAPHNTSSYVSLVGGGSFPKPGEITLAHRGALFLDEFPEFDRKVIEALRQPLEDKVVSISRSKGTATFPADFILIAAMNPCPCGNLGSEKECTCPQYSIMKYKKRISGPIIDRIDMWTEVPLIRHAKLGEKDDGSAEKSETIKQRVVEARARAWDRFSETKRNIYLNSQMSAKEIEEFVPLQKETRDILNQSAEKLKLSARSYHKIIKLARTIADLDKSGIITTKHILEALRYRPKLDSV